MKTWVLITPTARPKDMESIRSFPGLELVDAFAERLVLVRADVQTVRHLAESHPAWAIHEEVSYGRDDPTGAEKTDLLQTTPSKRKERHMCFANDTLPFVVAPGSRIWVRVRDQDGSYVCQGALVGQGQQWSDQELRSDEGGAGAVGDSNDSVNVKVTFLGQEETAKITVAACPPGAPDCWGNDPPDNHVVVSVTGSNSSCYATISLDVEA